jgi:hypothetical protein
MQWLRKEIVDHGKITVISDQHLGIRVIFKRPDLDDRNQQVGLFTVIILNTLHIMYIRTVI